MGSVEEALARSRAATMCLYEVPGHKETAKKLGAQRLESADRGFLRKSTPLLPQRTSPSHQALIQGARHGEGSRPARPAIAT